MEDGGAIDRTYPAGQAYRSLGSVEATRVAQAGYQSMLGAPSVDDSSQERYKVGERIGDRYEVLDVHLGSMGVVYATFDHEERLPRALKGLRRRYAGNRRMQELFGEEAGVWVRLEKHPYIVRAYLVEQFDGQPYVITEYVRGQEGMGGCYDSDGIGIFSGSS